jgi:hypothetical protein
MCALVNNSKKLENIIIKVFTEKFKRRKDIGREYFEGNIDQMAIEFTKLVKKWGKSIITMTPIKDEAIKDEAIKDEAIKDEAIKDEAIKDEAIKDEAIKNKPKKYEMNYCCKKCHKGFPQKSNYLTHVNRKKSCVSEEYEQEKISKKTCQYCYEMFSSPQSTKTHMNTCSKKPSKDEEFAQIIAQLNNKINELSKKIDTNQIEKKPKKKTKILK